MTAKTAFATILAALTLAAALTASCSRREHIREDFGERAREFYFLQAQAATEGSGDGLDSEEAAHIHARYRQVLGSPPGQAQTGVGTQVLVVEDKPAAPRRR